MAGTVKQKIVIEGDTSKLSRSANEASRALNNTSNALKATGRSNDDLDKSIQRSSASLKASTDNYKEAKRQLSILDSEIKRYGKDSEQAKRAQERFNKSVDASAREYNEARVALLKAERELARMKTATGATTTEMRAMERAVARARKSVNRHEAAVKRLEAQQATLAKGTDRFGAALKGFATIAGIRGAAGAISEMADRSVKLTAAQSAFKSAFSNSTQALKDARSATQNMVADFDLIVASNKAATLGVVKTGAEFAKLARVATKLGAAVGQDATKSVEDLTTALGRQSPMILDNLGITLKVSEAQEEYAKRLGKTAAELTDAEKKQAFMTIGLEKAEEAASKLNVQLDENAVKVAALGAEWQNFVDTIAPAVTAVLGSITTAVKSAGVGIGELTARLTLGSRLADARRAEAEADAAEVADIERRTAELAKIAEEAQASAAATEDRLEAMRDLEFEQQIAGPEQVDPVDELLGRADREGPVETSFAAQERTRKKLEQIEKERERERKRRRGGRRREIEAGQGERGFEGVDLSTEIAEAQVQRTEEALEREIALREQKLELLALEKQVGTGRLDIVAQEKEAQRELFDLQEELAIRRGETEEFALEQQRKALEKRLAIQKAEQEEALKAQRAREKALAEEQKKAEKIATDVAGSLGQVTVAAVEAANAEEGAVAKVVASWAKGEALRMALVSAREFALAVASAASFNIPGAVAHAAAGGQAAAVAAAMGAVAGGVGAAIPSGGGEGGGGGDSAVSVGGAFAPPSTGGGGTVTPAASTGRSGGPVDTEVPISRPADDAGGGRTIEVQIGQVTVLGNAGPAERANIGRELWSAIKEAERADGELER